MKVHNHTSHTSHTSILSDILLSPISNLFLKVCCLKTSLPGGERSIQSHMFFSLGQRIMNHLERFSRNEGEMSLKLLVHDCHIESDRPHRKCLLLNKVHRTIRKKVMHKKIWILSSITEILSLKTGAILTGDI